MNKKNKNKTKFIAYGIIITVCTVMVILDNTLLAPQSSHANTLPAPPAPAATTPSTTPLPTTTPTNSQEPTPLSPNAARTAITLRLAQHAKHYTSNHVTIDAFTPPLDWIPVKEDTPISQTTESPRAPKHNLTLNAVMTDPQGGIAIINGESLRIGQVIEGYTLQNVTQNKVTLKQGENPVELELQPPNLSKP